MRFIILEEILFHVSLTAPPSMKKALVKNCYFANFYVEIIVNAIYTCCQWPTSGLLLLSRLFF